MAAHEQDGGRARLCGVALGATLLVAGCARSDERWRADLDDADAFVRAVAALALSAQAPERAGAAVGVLLETVDRTELGLQDQALRGLGRLAPYAAEELVTQLLGDELLTRERRAAVLSALASSGPSGAETIVAAVRGSGRDRAGELGVVLVRLGPDAVGPLAELLQEAGEPRLQGYAAFVLGQLGAAGRAALPALRGQLAHPDPQVRAAVEQALRGIESGAATLRGPPRNPTGGG